MCGFAGFIDPALRPRDELRSIAQCMADQLAHRGPDDGDAWVDEARGIALGHRRLAILDLSPEGRQPMHSPSGRFVIVFNGEVYNFKSLRLELEARGYAFRGHSDTEVMLAAFEQWGIESAIAKFNGMFAFALWDRADRALYLARDRLGEKPLYYGLTGRTFFFASELKAFYAYPGFAPEINRDAIALLMRFCCIPAPHSIYTGIFKLPPGALLRFSPASDSLPAPRRYWSLKAAIESKATAPFRGNAAAAGTHLDALLREATAMRMIADVPIGAFLSGGIDSTTVVALMQAQSNRPINTYSIGFHETGFDEAPYASAVARYLHTAHTEFYVTAREALAVVPDLPRIYDEPFADSSQIPTFLVARLARSKVTVALSGDGGDELFGGYSRYRVTPKLWRRIAWLPSALRRRLAAAISATLTNAGSAVGSPARNRLATLVHLLQARDRNDFHFRLVCHWKDPGSVVIGTNDAWTVHTDSSIRVQGCDFRQHLAYLDTISYLPDDILVKVDRAAMAVGLETRAPLLDHRVVEFAARLPFRFKLQGRETKCLLREVLYRYVPRKLVDRPKMGFALPIDRWLRGPLRDWAEALLDETRLRADGFFETAPIRQKWQEHLSGAHDWQNQLWAVLMFQAWLEQAAERSAAAAHAPPPPLRLPPLRSTGAA